MCKEGLRKGGSNIMKTEKEYEIRNNVKNLAQWDEVYTPHLLRPRKKNRTFTFHIIIFYMFDFIQELHQPSSTNPISKYLTNRFSQYAHKKNHNICLLWLGL
jgi:hypothetical protein